MNTVNYSNITCPVSLQVIADCDCQNCVVARIDADYETWIADRNFNFALRLAVGSLAALIVAGFMWAVQR
jgi:hypothetical protein